MDREYEPSHASSPTTVTTYRDTIEPGQSSRSALMRKPEHVIASGLIQPKRWHGSGASRHAAVQMKGDGPGTSDIHELAARGTVGSATTLPFLENIQRSFGAHDVSGIEAHVGGPATQACQNIGALAYATGNHVAFRGAPDLHTAAHEAAHVVQQRAGVHLANGVGQEGDEYEKHADRVADAVVAGRSAEALLGVTGQRGQSPESSGQAERAGVHQKKDDVTSDSSCPKCRSGNCSCAKPPASNTQRAVLQQRHGAQVLQREADDGGLVSDAGTGAGAGAEPMQTLKPGVCNHPHAACSAADNLTGEQVVCFAKQAGFTGAALTTAVAVARAESGWDRCCYSSTADVGLWQINQVNWKTFGGRDALYDAGTNARAAYKLSSGGKSFSPWNAFKNGSYKIFLAEAQQAVKSAQCDGKPDDGKPDGGTPDGGTPDGGKPEDR